MFVSDSQAHSIARRELKRTPVISIDPLFTPWSDASVGDPVLVRDVFKNPSYWIVPVLIHERVAGFIRVLGTGKVAALGTFYQDPSEIRTCPTTVTGINSSEAKHKAMERIHPEKGETALDPLFVHDGPPGREAWLIEVTKEGKPSRWIFVTPAFIYERLAGELLDETLE